MPEKRIAIIAAMEREVAPLIRSWKVRMMEHGGRRFRLFEKGDVAVICGGIGAAAARRATEAVIQEVKPSRVLSAGFAGALDGSLRVADVIEPRVVINTTDGVRTEVASGEGTLLSSATVADKEQKRKLGMAYGASAVDMEAAAVAQGAQARGVEFGALKAISDAADFSLPAMDRFVTDDGGFRAVRFACHMAVRPWMWRTTMALARNSSRASHALCAALTSYLGRETLSGESSGGDLNPSKVGAESASAHTGAGTQPHTQGGGKQQRKAEKQEVCHGNCSDITD